MSTTKGKAVKKEPDIKKKKLPKTERLPIIRSPSFNKYYATNIIGGLTEHDFRFELLNEKMESDEGWCVVSDALVIFSPKAAKKIHMKLDEYLKLFEAENGKIDITENKEWSY